MKKLFKLLKALFNVYNLLGLISMYFTVHLVVSLVEGSIEIEGFLNQLIVLVIIPAIFVFITMGLLSLGIRQTWKELK